MNADSTTSGEDRRPGRALSRSGRPEFGQGSASALSMKWSALHDAAGAVAMLAGREVPSMSPEIRNFPAVMREAGGWRGELAEQGIADIAAVMEPGLSALLAVHARGMRPAGAALALWEDFVSARDALLGLTPPRNALPQRRLA